MMPLSGLESLDVRCYQNIGPTFGRACIASVSVHSAKVIIKGKGTEEEEEVVVWLATAVSESFR